MKIDVSRFIKKNASTILSCVGGIGVVMTSALAVKATPKALQLIDEAKKEKDLTKWETVKLVGKVYIPSVTIGLATVACIFGANALNKQQQASLISAYAMIDNSYKEYKRKLKEIYGEEAHQKIVDALAIEKSKKPYISASCLCTNCNLALDDSSENSKLFYEEYSNRYFEATIEQVISAEYHLNRNFALRGYVTVNELYEFLGLELTDYGSELGWCVSDDEIYWIDFNHRKVTIDNDLECYIIETPFSPSLEWKEYY